MRGRLNLFQATMLRWREMHPYSAVHAVHVALPLDARRLEAAIRHELEARGLANLTLDAARGRFDYGGGESRSVPAVLPGGTDPRAVLRAEFARQLNLPFPADGAIDPFRFFAVDAGGTFEFALAYDHFVAGGDSIVLLLQAIVARYEAARELRGTRVRLGPSPACIRIRSCGFCAGMRSPFCAACPACRGWR